MAFSASRGARDLSDDRGPRQDWRQGRVRGGLISSDQVPNILMAAWTDAFWGIA